MSGLEMTTCPLCKRRQPSAQMLEEGMYGVSEYCLTVARPQSAVYRENCRRVRDQLDKATTIAEAAGVVGTADAVDHPRHYNSHPSGVEAITICEHYGFNLGNALKYIWRGGLKGGLLEDLRKGRWYLDREIARLEKAAK